MHGSILRAGVWVGGILVGGAMFGMQWATQSVQVPLWALLVLTFVPTRELIESVRTVLKGLQDRVEPNGGSR